MKKLYSAVVCIAVAASLASPYAAAHASLKSSSPQAGAVLAAAPKQISLTFNERVEGAFSSVTVADGQGKTIATEKAQVDQADPSVVRLDVPALSVGTYTVRWAVAGHDGHRRKGEFKFTVK